MLLLTEDSDSSVAKEDDDDDDEDFDDHGVDSSTGTCLASVSQHVYLPDSQLKFHKCRDVNADRPAKVCCTCSLSFVGNLQFFVRKSQLAISQVYVFNPRNC